MLELLSKFRKVLNPFVVNVNPNIMTVLALIMAVFAGYFFYLSQFLLAGIFVLLNGFFDILDGEIAKRYKKQTKFGDFLDHTFDRLADVAMFFGIAINPTIDPILGFSTIIAVLLVSYLGTQAQALTKERLYAGLIGRSDRLILLVIISFLAIKFNILHYGLWIILILSIITFLQRYWTISQQLK